MVTIQQMQAWYSRKWGEHLVTISHVINHMNAGSEQTIAKCEFYKLLIELSLTQRILLSMKAHINVKYIFIHYYKQLYE